MYRVRHFRILFKFLKGIQFPNHRQESLNVFLRLRKMARKSVATPKDASTIYLFYYSHTVPHSQLLQIHSFTCVRFSKEFGIQVFQFFAMRRE